MVVVPVQGGMQCALEIVNVKCIPIDIKMAGTPYPWVYLWHSLLGDLSSKWVAAKLMHQQPIPVNQHLWAVHGCSCHHLLLLQAQSLQISHSCQPSFPLSCHYHTQVHHLFWSGCLCLCCLVNIRSIPMGSRLQLFWYPHKCISLIFTSIVQQCGSTYITKWADGMNYPIKCQLVIGGL